MDIAMVEPCNFIVAGDACQIEIVLEAYKIQVDVLPIPTISTVWFDTIWSTMKEDGHKIKWPYCKNMNDKI